MESSINIGKKLAVIGSRDFDDYNLLATLLIKHEPRLVVSGGANGADELANRFCREYGKPILIFYPDWHGLGKKAGHIRNTMIVEMCEEVLAFQVNKSRGTQDSINKARELNKKVYLYEFNSDDTKNEDFGF